jgi:release factor-specific protein-(glutamine-N5) methyltransferase
MADAADTRRDERPWTVGDALAWTVDYLGRKGVENPRRSAEWLLSAATGLSRIELYAKFDRPLTPAERASFRTGIERRAAGEPLQYVTGEMPFRHLVLHVRPGVFIPRPETEVLVDAVLEFVDSAGLAEPLVVDLCTGSCAVAASVAHERAGARVYATEIVPATGEVARDNAERAGVSDRVEVLVGDLFGPLPADIKGRVDVVVSNPPYIPTADLADLPVEVAAHEPMIALDGGADGLDVVRRIAEQARGWLRPGGLLAIETDSTRAEAAARVLEQWYEGIEVRKDLAGRDRIVIGIRREA